MRLKKIELRDFKRFVDFQAQFSPGINVVKGPLNEMGKSTLLDAITVALFENPKSTANKLKGYVSWGSARQFHTSIEFEDEGQGYLLEKDFDKGTARLTADNKREEVDTFKEISGKMAELLGTDSDKLFLCSSCIRQSEVSRISSGEKEINESLEEIVSGGRESTLASQVIEKLDERISETRKGLDRPAKNPGILASLRSRLQDASRRYNEVRDEVSKVEARKIELVAANEQLAQVKEQYENSKALLEKNRQRKEIEASTKALKQKYDETQELLGGINELTTRLEKADKALGSIEGFGNEPQVLEFKRKLDAIQNRRGDIENDLAQRENELAEAKEKFGGRKAARFLGSGSGIATALTILVGGIIGAWVVSLYFLSLAVLGAALLAVAMRARTAFVRDKTSISVIEGRVKEMKEALVELGKEQNELLAEAKCNAVGEFDKKERDFKFRLKEKNSLEAQLKGVLRGKKVEDFEKQEREIARDLAVERAKLTEDLTETRISPEEYIELERKVRTLEAKQVELEKQKRRCEAIIEQARFTVEDQIKLEEELEELQEALRHEEKKMKIYGLAREFIATARTEVLSSAGEALEKGIQKYLAVFTNNKYNQVRVNKGALEFWVYSDEKGDWARPEELSGGAIDEFYLAFRLALVKLIFGDRKPPLILDDPFVNFDSVRLDNTLDFLKALASDYQIIIFTLGDSYDKVADNIILLGEGGGPPSTRQQIEGG